LQNRLHQIEIAGGKLLQRGRVEPQANAEGLLQPGQNMLIELCNRFRCTRGQHAEFAEQQGKNDQRQSGKEQRQRDQHRQHGARAWQAEAGQAVDGGVGDVGQDARQQERREDARERIQQDEHGNSGGDPERGVQTVGLG